MTAGGKQVRGQGQTLTPPTNYCQMLQEIAEVQRFEVQYFDIKDDSAAGKRELGHIFILFVESQISYITIACILFKLFSVLLDLCHSDLVLI